MTTAVECKLIRQGGTRDTLHGTEYHFQPYTCGAHVAQIADPEHVDIYLSIPEGYRLYRGNGQPVGAVKPVAANVAAAVAKATVRNPEPVAVVAAAEPAVAAIAPVAVGAPVEILLGGDYPASFDIHGKTYALGTVVAQAHAASGLDVTDWNAQPQDARDILIEDELNRIQAAGAPQEEAKQEAPVVDERAALAAEYERLYGKKAHHNTGVEKLRELIAAKQ